MKMRGALAALILMAAAGCDPLAQAPGPLAQVAGLAGAPALDPRFAALQRSGAPALQIGLIDRKLSSLLLLEARRAGRDTWLSADGASLILREGFVVGTRGLGGGLLASDVSQPMALVLARREGWSDRFHTFLSGDDRAVIRTYRCRIETMGDRVLDLPRGRTATVLMKETCRSLTQSFFNLYWVDPTRSEIVQSRQWAGDYTGAISTRLAQ